MKVAIVGEAGAVATRVSGVLMKGISRWTS